MINLQTSLVVQLLRLYLPLQGVWAQSLVEELRLLVPVWQKKKPTKNNYNING